MKKIIGILGVVAFALTIFFTTKSSTSSDINLESLLAVKTASAEISINAPWEKVCFSKKRKCTWRAFSSNRSCKSNGECGYWY